MVVVAAVVVVAVTVAAVTVLSARGQGREDDAGEGWQSRGCSPGTGRITPGEHTPHPLPPPRTSPRAPGPPCAPQRSGRRLKSDQRGSTGPCQGKAGDAVSGGGGSREDGRRGAGGPGDGDSEATRGAQWGEEEEGFHRVCSVAGDAIAPCVKSRPQRHFSRLRDQRRAPRLQRADGGTEKVLAQPGRSRSIRDQRAPGWGRWSPERECWGLSRLLGRDPPPPEPAARTVEFRPVPARPGTTGPSRTAN